MWRATSRGYTNRDVVSTSVLTRREGGRVAFSTNTGFVRWTTHDLTDLDYTPLPLFTRDNQEENAQFTQEEFAIKSHWGHCTIDYAVAVAREAGVGRLALFHHDPAHGDDTIDRILEHACRAAEAGGPDEVIAASEGLTVALG